MRNESGLIHVVGGGDTVCTDVKREFKGLFKLIDN